MPNDPKGPQSPDNLGVHGRVEGVTRIGARAIILGVIVLGVLVAGIVYGLNSGKQSQQAQNTTLPPVAPVQQTAGPHFGEDVPIVETPPPDTPPPAVLLPPSPPPLASETTTPAAVASTGPSAAELAEEKRLDAERQRELDEEKARQDDLKRANEAPILAAVGNGSGGGFSGNGSSGPGSTRTGGGTGAVNASGTVAGPNGAGGQAGPNGATGPGGATGAAGAAGAGGAGGAGGPGGAAAQGAGAQQTPLPTSGSQNTTLAFLNGPTGQFAAAPYSLPQSGPRDNNLPANRYAASTIFELLAGAVIPAELVTGIDSDEPGLVTGQVREDVYDTKSGKYLLIPKGARLIGVYQSGGGYGNSRVLVAWQRLIFPDTSSIDLLAMTGADVQGGGGLGGKVDAHTGQLIFGTLLSSVLAAGLALSQPTTTTVATTTSGTVAVPSQGALAAQGVGAQLTSTTQGLIQKTLNQPPTIYIPKGYPFLVIVDRDMVFPGPYGPSL